MNRSSRRSQRYICVNKMFIYYVSSSGGPAANLWIDVDIRPQPKFRFRNLPRRTLFGCACVHVNTKHGNSFAENQISEARAVWCVAKLNTRANVVTTATNQKPIYKWKWQRNGSCNSLRQFRKPNDAIVIKSIWQYFIVCGSACLSDAHVNVLFHGFGLFEWLHRSG